MALVNQVDQLTHQVDDVTTDQLMTSDFPLYWAVITKKTPGGVAVELAELALVNQVDQLIHQVDDVTTD